MINLALRIYDWMSGHRWWCLASLAVVTLLMVLSVTRLSYREDIRDFLPLDEKEREALNDYDRQAQTSLIVAIIEQRDSTVDDPDLLVEGVETFLDAIDGLEGVTVQTDFSQMEEQQEEAYRQLPYLLEAADYQRMDSLLQQPDFIASRLQEAKERLLMPMGMGSMMEDEITHDPLGLFSPVVSLMRDTAMLSRFDIYDGCLLTADHRRALVMLNSPYGGSETSSNEQLLEILNTKADSILSPLTSHHSPLNSNLSSLTIRFCGAPVIAVTNASQIKADSLLSVCIAAVLILLLLWFFLRSLKHILLIALTIGWGWVFAIACLSWVHQEVSVIVIGISSIIVGIAVNYPLHLIAHLSHTSDVRQALKEIVKPLVVGNITTVGAFLALVPLRAAALRDLGLFSSFLLIGTILFTIIWLPQILLFTSKFTVYSLQFTDDYSAASERLASKSSVNRKLSTVNKNTPLLLAALLLLTAFFGYHSLHTAFDADLTHINYMTPVQRSDMALLQQLMPTDSPRQQELNRRLPSTPETQQQRLQLWQSWTSSHRDQLALSLRDEATRAGFTPSSFDPFFALIISRNEEGKMRKEDTPAADSVSDISPSSFLLPLSSNSSSTQPSLFSSIASHLSDDFNYIGWACACIVFFFLWASFRSLPLALLSFLPMAVSWLWILGIMALLGIQFNIINIILSTFIFGQGDDYTIFMTEGTVYEYKHHRPMLASYRRAIMLSALIMFIGIGSLIIARHPALHSLAEVTIVGMFSVVLMAFIIPPLAFRLWIKLCEKLSAVKGNHL